MFQTARTDSDASFRSAFARWRAVVHRRHALAWGLRGATAGATAVVAAATVAWATGHGGAFVLGALAVPLGAAVGAGLAWWRRWDDASVALYLDAKGGSAEVITTALQAGDGLPREVREHLRREAVLAMRAMREGSLRRVASRWQLVPAAMLVAGAALALGPRATPAAPRVASMEAEGDRVQMEAPAGWSAVEAVGRLPTRDEARRARLEALSAEARRLRERLATGVDRREAMTAMERLRAAVAEERSRMWQGNSDRGVEQAAGVLSRAGFSGAAQALEAQDLDALDRAMERLANARESADRERARQALSDAAVAALQVRAGDVAEALREEERLLHRRADRNQLLRALATQLGRSEEVRRAAEHLERLPSDESARDLAEVMERALASLTAQERERVAERMRQALARPASASRAGDPADEADAQAEGAGSMTAEELARRLREFAQADDEGGAAGGGTGGRAGGGVPVPVPGGETRAMQRGLAGAEDGLGGAMAQLGGQDGQGRGQRGGAGGGRGGGAGEHGGSTAAIEGREGLRARARGVVRGGGTGPASVQRINGSAGGVARTVRTGALEGAAAEELRGVDRSDIPAEYRSQVRTYFQPR